jgi:hypothetical protein
MQAVGHVEGETSSLELDERAARTARTPVVSGSFTERRGDSGSFVGLLAGIERPNDIPDHCSRSRCPMRRETQSPPHCPGWPVASSKASPTMAKSLTRIGPAMPNP